MGVESDIVSPTADISPMTNAAEPASRPAAQAPLPLRVYFVEDSPVIVDVLITTLQEMLDVEIVGSAASEASVLRWLRSPDARRADVMIVDLFLAHGSGLAVLQAARDSGVACARVVLTNYATPVIRDRCRQLGAARVFDKSNELRELVEFLGGVEAQAAR